MVSNTKLAEEFAEGKTKGKGSHMFIEGNTIYSYGHHFPIAKITGDKTADFNESKYSVTTSKQQTYVRRALEAKGFKVRKLKEMS